MNHLLNKLVEKQDLPIIEAEFLMEEILRGDLTNTQIASILMALRMKRETTNEILGFIKVLRKHMIKIKTSGLIIDTCGTGGDGKGTFNISTAVSLVVAGAGVKVAKHGNRAVSSECGSADVLEALGVNINQTPDSARRCLEERGFVFLFAPLFHPAFKNVVQARRELGIKTIFNYLGPFLNPAGVKRQLIGVSNYQMAEKLAEVATKLGYEHLLVVVSRDGLDEISLSEKSDVFEVRGRKVKKIVIDPHEFGFKSVSLDKFRGRDAKMNAQIINRILNGEKGARRDIVVLNSAAALYAAGKVKNIRQGIHIAQDAIDCGCAKKLLARVINVSQRL